MTQPPKGSAAPPVAGAPTVPPQQSRPAPPASGPAPPAVAPPRRTAFAEGVDRLRAAATTEPGRLRIIGALIALLVVAFGAVTAWQATDRAAAADDVLNNSQPLSSAAADIYRSLADANTAASSGFLAGGQETKASRERYEKDIRTAAEKLVLAANNSEPGSRSAETITELNRLLPQYKGLIERARANNRQGFPLGGAYLRYANDTMQTKMLPAAEDLYTTENERLRGDYADATPYPWTAIALGVLALAALAWAQHRTYLRTNRVLNHGLVAATAATTVVLLWLVVGHSLARAGLNDSYDHGVRSLTVLHDARIASLKARGNENLTLVSRGAETVEVGGKFKDKFDVAHQASMRDLAAGLDAAEELADDQAGTRPVRTAAESMDVWKQRHQQARDADDAGDYQAALSKIIGSRSDEPTGECFDNVDRSLEIALEHETLEFEQAAGDGRDAMTGLPAGAAALAVLGAAGAVLGIGRRLSEYR
ncbi:hypothetical protein [Streptomyces chromofuscus]|uniref:Secreted protein n=1 Tax=Streptomyces chromofuscus TaxID=42881 RepID=A0A7M2TDA4_STRCW|nr:hypothetical protein [Streptomyces chromofuscus]QOV46716.1 hypothetical protein IPT68_12990 [Streptomyces chromofuscus]GGT09060.1 hypothetical protein GCM10010254_32110 [Streptomyces chromofuscus]